ncbi:hypothetical protein K2173_003319 [Erythroxylum novogranatense]|uniref:Bifunctional inhibitor/plant lipid transfer protein/seed storage helical domain-containing protein n=1 Tax=Erythroxylum novogranatense TaxID=1862640 RepID=A0AAV8SX96_9ROSI|nr:hypothetical protein K2173_003319 [Erythroxylum novogranatense]
MIGGRVWGCLLLLWFVWSNSGFVVVSGESLSQECQDDFQKVMKCMNYATGKADTPTKDCCSAVQEVKASDAKCLCYIMQQTHSGSGNSQLRSLGIQESRLLQLPSACQLQNATVSYCPKLLGLPPNSPDAAIFTNASTTAAPNTTTTAAPEKSGDSGSNNRRHLFSGPLVIAVAILIYAFPDVPALLDY